MPPSQLGQSANQPVSQPVSQPARQPEVRPYQSRWQKLYRETRTRILLMYAVILLLLMSLSIPLFKYLLFERVDSRVRRDLEKERMLFLEAYTDWAAEPQHTSEDLKAFVDQFLNEIRPEDDNFQIVLVDRELYRSNPPSLLKPLSPGSRLFDRWQSITRATVGEEKMASLPDIGSIIYIADPIVLNGQVRGVFVVAHSSAGELQEASAGIFLFIEFMLGAVLISLLLSWLGAGRLMAPIAELSTTARAIGEADLTQRIPTPKSDGELADLTHTFNAMMDRIQAAFDSQRDFINDAGHELRTPITIIQGHLELLDGDPQERQETMELVMDELDRMGRLVSDMLLLAKAERPNFLQLETIDVLLFTEELFVKATALAERNWVLTLQGQGKLVGDRQKLTGALLNLLRNATQYTQVADTIELGCCRIENNQIQFWVSDTGEGISLEDQRQIFARFARGRQRRSEGSGLGLAIVSAIAEAHGGYVTLASQVGEGSRFQMTLPIEPPKFAVGSWPAAR